MDFRIDNSNVEANFDNIAVQLLNNYNLQINKKEFQLTEIEFYFFCDEHPDGYTYKHDEIPGKLRFHYSGVDITLGSKQDFGHGGILIRGIQSIPDNIKTNGPLKVVLEMSKPFNNIFEATTIKFVNANSPRTNKLGVEIITTERINLKKPIEQGDFQKSHFRYKLQ